MSVVLEPPLRVLGLTETSFAQHYNKECFRFGHSLHRRQIFASERVVELSERARGAYCSTHEGAIEDGWGNGNSQPAMVRAVATLVDSKALVLVKGLTDDPDFGPACREVLAELIERVGEELRADLSASRATLIASSPGRVTPYHIDAETNFLFQIHGRKTVSVFAPHDRSLLSERELEAFYAGDLSAAKYRKERQGEARVFELGPGDALHIPILSPHWVQNGDDVSIAVSFNCSLRSNERLAKLYRFNALLRRHGLRPAPAGTSPWRDRVKVALADAASFVRRLGARA